MAAERPSGKATRPQKLNFRLELKCDCKPPICPHAGPGIAKLLEAAYAKGHADGSRDRASRQPPPRSSVRRRKLDN